MLTDEEIVDHVQHMGCKELRRWAHWRPNVELIENIGDHVDMKPSKMTPVECRECLKGIANFVAQDACLGEERLLQVQRLANKLLAMQVTCIMDRKRNEIKRFFPVVDI